MQKDMAFISTVPYLIPTPLVVHVQNHLESFKIIIVEGSLHHLF